MTQPPQSAASAPEDWAAARRQAAAERARLMAARTEAEHRRAAGIVALFLTVAAQRGLRSQPLRVQGYDGSTARTSLRGWYLRADHGVALTEDGGFVVLRARLGWRERLTGYSPATEPVPLVIGEGGRDGDVVSLRTALNDLLPGWEEDSPEPLP